MDFIIWGSGYRGRHVCQFIGEKRTAAFIDQDIKKQGKKVYGKDVISYAQYRTKYKDRFIIVSPNNSDEIVRLLEEDKEVKYFILSEEIGECFGWGQKDILECLFKRVVKGIPNIIFGINLISMILMDELQTRGYGEVKIVPHKTMRAEKKLIFKKKYPKEYTESLDNIQVDVNAFLAKREMRDQCQLYRHFLNARDFFKQYSNYYNAEIEKFRNVHKNETCVIVATGPSIRVDDLDILKNKHMITLSMNKIFHVFDKTEWRPDYYFVNDRMVFSQNMDSICRMDVKYKFVSDNCKINSNNGFLRHHLNVCEGCYDNVQDFSDDAAWGIYFGSTVTYSCIQFAVYMGFKVIYLLGVDFNYGKMGEKGNHFYEQEDKINFSFLENGSLKAYHIARQYAEDHDIKIFNATRGGKLEVFDRVDFDEIFNN